MAETATEAPENLLTALLAFQAEAPRIQKDKLNPAFKSKYISLDGLMAEAMPVLNKHGLAWVTMPLAQLDGPILRYRLIHVASGEEIQGEMPLMLDKTNPQGQGSAITYARRYSMLAVLGLVADEDDDGAQASKGNGGAVRRGVSAQPAQTTERAATARQRGLINGKAGEKGIPPIDLANMVLAATESEPRDFESQSEAEEWLRRAMDRLPAKHVDAVLAAIEKADPGDLEI